MTVVAKDADQWRRSVDKKLNLLTTNYKDLNDRLDSYAKDMAKNTDLTKGIDKKIDELVASTAIAVEIAARASKTTKVIHWLWNFSTKVAVILGQYGVALLVVLTAYSVYNSGAPWIKSFINIFNGNLN